MAIYPKKVADRAFAPAHCEPGSYDTACGRSASFSCGCFVSFSLAQRGNGVGAKFTTNGCGYMTAAADLLADIVSRDDIARLHGLERSELIAAVAAEIGDISNGRITCVDVCIEALKAAFVELRRHRVEEFTGEKALICTCFGISEETIDNFITSANPATVDEVTAACRAGGGCGSCRMLIQEMIDSRQMP